MGNNHVNFGQAIEAAKQGKRVARSGWNGKGMFVFQRQGFSVKKGEFKFDSRYGESVQQYMVEHNLIFTPVLCLKAADNSIVTGWLASQTDILAEDWIILD